MGCKKDICNYNNYYLDQAGGKLDISYYRGQPYQRGYGAISTYAKRYGIPVLKYLLKQGFNTGRDIFNDLREGKKFSHSAKLNLKRRAGTILKDLGENIEQAGSGLRKKPKLIKKHRKHKKKINTKQTVKVNRRKKKSKSNKSKSKKYKDIFG
jgi:hypothetical protein